MRTPTHEESTKKPYVPIERLICRKVKETFKKVWKNKIGKVIMICLSVFLGITVYMHIGYLYNYGVNYAAYYPDSVTSKFLIPAPDRFINTQTLIPLFDADPAKESFAEYNERETLVAVAILWPFVLLFIYGACLINWIWWLLTGAWWLLKGGLVLKLLS